MLVGPMPQAVPRSGWSMATLASRHRSRLGSCALERSSSAASSPGFFLRFTWLGFGFGFGLGLGLGFGFGLGLGFYS